MKVLITSGGTKIRMDDVRFLDWDFWGDGGRPVLANFSKGGFGSKLAYSFLHILDPTDTVCHLHATDAANLVDQGWPNYQNTTFFDYHDYVEKLEALCQEHQFDLILLAAAVSDYGLPYTNGKISSDNEEITITLRKLPKVISKVKKWNPDCIQIGFKLLSNVSVTELIDVAMKSGNKSGSDFTIANDLASLKSGNHTIYLVDHSSNDPSPIPYSVAYKSHISLFVKSLLKKCQKKC